MGPHYLQNYQPLSLCSPGSAFPLLLASLLPKALTSLPNSWGEATQDQSTNTTLPSMDWDTHFPGTKGSWRPYHLPETKKKQGEQNTSSCFQLYPALQVLCSKLYDREGIVKCCIFFQSTVIWWVLLKSTLPQPLASGMFHENLAKLRTALVPVMTQGKPPPLIQKIGISWIVPSSSTLNQSSRAYSPYPSREKHNYSSWLLRTVHFLIILKLFYSCIVYNEKWK